MIKIGKNTNSGKFVVLEWRNGMWNRGEFDTIEEAQARFKQLKRNANKRAENEVLRTLCGTSARAARLDMGL